MEQEAQGLSHWPAAQHQFSEVGRASAPGQGVGAGVTRLREWREADPWALGVEGRGWEGWEIEDRNRVSFIELILTEPK